mgnify:CR=1 FL=1
MYVCVSLVLTGGWALTPSSCAGCKPHQREAIVEYANHNEGRDGSSDASQTLQCKYSRCSIVSSLGYVAFHDLLGNACSCPSQLEEAISYVDQDELMEVTPKSIRLRKLQLNPTDRKKNKRQRDAPPQL